MRRMEIATLMTINKIESTKIKSGLKDRCGNNKSVDKESGYGSTDSSSAVENILD